MEQSLNAPSQSPQAQLTATMTNLSNFEGRFWAPASGCRSMSATRWRCSWTTTSAL